MVKSRLMLGAAFAALGLFPIAVTPASAQLVEGYDLDIYSDWDNDVEVSLEWNVDVDKYLDIRGNISIDGNVRADALAHATLDDKQTLDQNEVQFEDYQNAFQNEPTLNQDNEPGLGFSTGSPNFIEEGLPSGPAEYDNLITAGAGTLAGASGNIGLNMAAGDYNLQENAAVLASTSGNIPALNFTRTSSFGQASGGANTSVNTWATTVGTVTTSTTNTTASTNTSTATGTEIENFTSTAYTSGGAEAGSFSLQSLYDNGFNDESFELENTDIDNSVNLAGIAAAATGNIGVNAAAGAFNIQKNALVIASVTAGNLAEATAGTLQHAQWNDSVHEDTSNNINLGTSLAGASGNIGVNLAAGVGNLQLNSLTIASTVPDVAAPPAGTGTGPGGGGTITGG